MNVIYKDEHYSINNLEYHFTSSVLVGDYIELKLDGELEEYKVVRRKWTKDYSGELQLEITVFLIPKDLNNEN